jgi:hypothetical protein
VRKSGATSTQYSFECPIADSGALKPTWKSFTVAMGVRFGACFVAACLGFLAGEFFFTFGSFSAEAASMLALSCFVCGVPVSYRAQRALCSQPRMPLISCSLLLTLLSAVERRPTNIHEAPAYHQSGLSYGQQRHPCDLCTEKS